MSRNIYDSTTGTLTPIAGWQGVDSALSSTSNNPVKNSVLTGILDKTYKDDDASETTLADADYLPFYDTSATAKKKMLLSTARNDVRARIAEAVSNDVIETIGGTALNSYTVGQYFLGNDGYYYAATSAITAGTTTLNSGVSGNCSKTSIAEGMNRLISNISKGYVFLGAKGITLATSNGTKTVDTLLTEAFTAFKNLTVNDMVSGTTHFLPIAFSFPYGNSSNSILTLYDGNYSVPGASYSSAASLMFTRTTYSGTTNSALIYVVLMSSSNTCIAQALGSSATNMLTNKPNSGLSVSLSFSCYKYIS